MTSNTKENRTNKLKKRFFAFYLDLVAIGIIQKVIVYTYITCVNELLISIPYPHKQNLLSNTWKLTLSTLSFTLFSYFLMSYFLNDGKTLGKTFMKLRIYSEENGTPSLGESFTRSLIYTACYASGVFLLLMPFLTKSAKGLPDYLSHTTVLTEEEYEETLKQTKVFGNDEQLELFLAS